MADVGQIAMYGIGLDASNAVNSLNTFSGASDRAATATEKFEASTRRTQRAVMALPNDQSIQYMRGLAQASTEAGRRMAALEIQAYRMDAAIVASAQGLQTLTSAGGRAGTGINSLRSSATALTASLLGSAPGVAQFSSMLGTMAVGSAMMIGVLAGMSAVAFAWQQITKDSRAAADAQEKALAALHKLRIEQAAGGRDALEVQNASKEVDRLRARLVAQNARVDAFAPNSEGARIAGSVAAAVKKDYDIAVADLAVGEAKLAAARQHASQAQTDAQLHDLAQIISAHKANAQEIKNAESLLGGLRQSLGALAGDGSQNDARARLISQIRELNEALHPAKEARAAESEAERARKAALDQRMSEWNHFVEEQKRAYADASTDTVRQFEADDAERMRIAKENADEIRRANEQVTRDAAREQRRQIEETDRLLKSSFASFFTDVLTHGKSVFASLFDSIRQGFIRLLADMLAQKATLKLAGLFGSLLVPSVAGAQSGGAGGGPAVPYGALGSLDKAPGAGAGSYAAVGIGAGLVGYGIGQSMYSTSHGAAGNYARGALGGAAAGAAMGATLGPMGALVGGLAGLAGGLLGTGAAAREAAKRMAEARKAVELSMADLRASVYHETVAQGIAQIEADREQRRKAIEDAYSGGGSGSDTVRERNRQLTLLNALENERIRQLREEYALSQKQYSEDLQVRLLTAQGHDREARALALQLAQERERQALLKSFGESIDPTEAATLALLDQVQAQEKLKGATDAASASALNMVAGYKLQAAIFGAMTPRAGSIAPSSGRNQNAGGDLTVKVMMPNGNVLGKVVIQDFRNRQSRGDQSLATLLS